MLGAALAAVLAVSLSACGSDPVAQQYLDGDGKGYISADGAVEEIPVEERGEPVIFSGMTEHGEEFDSADIAGDVTVVNFWYAGCAPCRVEAGDLEKVWQEYNDDDVSFVGINIYDQPDTALSFAKSYGVTYPSIIDVDSGAAKLAFANATPIQATPTTLVLDKQGRVAARIIGQLDGPSILSTLVKDALAESA
ncbi:thiol-disulfide isomerase/thioredoxin [Microbacterium ginsengiterrae]|uniref:Thiol-disulfide isomerase/thioredoxin n=1 Tax=Microbacterium ginsengiterrae TaxID=546115 RepID=A0A7W9CCX6_9MICO|nr:MULTISPECIES: TlpA disulfide reductase family protein [Microbacterium]MBB5743302.1 thiol-disulfide isomerase/thioredoxin [Microbacterium ginsengiterrae]